MFSIFKKFNVMTLLLCFSIYRCNAIELKNGKKVSQESIDKVSQAISVLQNDNTFENKIEEISIPPKILTEGLYLLGQRCQDGCDISIEQFMELMHKEFYIQQTYTKKEMINGNEQIFIDKEQKEKTDEKINYLYHRLSNEFHIIQDDIINSDDGAVLNASVKGSPDQHICGTSSRGFTYTDSISKSFMNKILLSWFRFKKQQKK